MLDHPELKGRPVIVGGSRERGVVSSASYEARAFGVHSAQPMATAIRLCPQATVLPVRMGRYREVSRQIFAIFQRFTPLVEPLSIDEAFLDVTGSVRLFGPAMNMARGIKQMVRQETGLTVSAGVAPNKFIAKIASDLEKPDGLTVVAPGDVQAFLDPLPIRRMWGAGRKTQETMGQMGVRTFRDLRILPGDRLRAVLGSRGIQMQQLAMGRDERDVVPEQDALSLGHEETFAKDILNLDAARKELLDLATRVARRMRSEGVEGSTVTLKVKYSDFELITRSKTLLGRTDDSTEIYAIACELLRKTQVGRRPVRLLGLSVSRLTPREGGGQLSLFEQQPFPGRRQQLHQALDSLYQKYGEKGPRPGTLIET